MEQSVEAIKFWAIERKIFQTINYTMDEVNYNVYMMYDEFDKKLRKLSFLILPIIIIKQGYIWCWLLLNYFMAFGDFDKFNFTKLFEKKVEDN